MQIRMARLLSLIGAKRRSIAIAAENGYNSRSGRRPWPTDALHSVHASRFEAAPESSLEVGRVA
jgi:hypothetical protein